MALALRAATPADLRAVSALLRAQFDEHAIALEPESLERAVAGLLEGPPRGRVLLAHDGAPPIGVACLAYTWTLEHGGASAWLDELYVAPESRGRGVGTALLRAAIAAARADGSAAVDLEVEEGHARAEHLYAREGFRPLARARWVLSLRT